MSAVRGDTQELWSEEEIAELAVQEITNFILMAPGTAVSKIYHLYSYMNTWMLTLYGAFCVRPVMG